MESTFILTSNGQVHSDCGNPVYIFDGMLVCEMCRCQVQPEGPVTGPVLVTGPAPFAIVVQDQDGAWHLRDERAWVPNATFAWYACDHDEQPVHIVEAVDIALAITGPRCPQCFGKAAA